MVIPLRINSSPQRFRPSVFKNIQNKLYFGIYLIISRVFFIFEYPCYTKGDCQEVLKITCAKHKQKMIFNNFIFMFSANTSGHFLYSKSEYRGSNNYSMSLLLSILQIVGVKPIIRPL